MYWGNDHQRKKHLQFLSDQYAFLQTPDTICPYLPNTLDIDIANRCNIKCISCFHDIEKFKHMDDMKFDTFKLVLDQAEGKASRITIGNHGEPFLHREVFKMLKEVKDRGFFLNLINNGTLLSKKKAEQLLDIEVDRLVFSLDSVDPENYPLIRKNANLRVTLRNILYFLKINYEKGLKTYVNISMVDTEQALKSKIDFFEYFSKLPVHVAYTSPILNFHDMLSIRKETKFYKKYQNIHDPKDMPVCINGFDRLLIRPNGNVSLCGIDWDSVYILGNVKDSPYFELWNNKKAQTYRQGLIDRDYSKIEENGILCSKCDSKWACSVEHQLKQTAELISSDMKDSKKELTAKINTHDRYENLLEELNRLEKERISA